MDMSKQACTTSQNDEKLILVHNLHSIYNLQNGMETPGFVTARSLCDFFTIQQVISGFLIFSLFLIFNPIMCYLVLSHGYAIFFIFR